MSILSTEISLNDVKITSIVLPIIAIIVTSFRLFDRTRMRKLWLDDAWAFISMIFIIIYMVAVILHVEDPASLSRSAKIGVYYMCAQFFYAVAWSARVSILFTVIRICPNGPTRTFLSWVAVAFGIAWVVLFAQVWWVCEREPGWKDALIPQCALGEKVAIAQVICDVISDAILIFAPVQLIKGVRLSRARKIQLISVFSTTAITTAVSLYHAFAVLRVGGFYEAEAASIQTSISLIIANLTVIVALVMRATYHEESESSNNREPLFLHSMSTRKRNRKADPLHALTTFEGTTFGGIKTTVETDVDDGVGRFGKYGAADKDSETASTGASNAHGFFAYDGESERAVQAPGTYQLTNFPRGEQSVTLVGGDPK